LVALRCSSLKFAGNRDDRSVDRLPQARLGDATNLAQHEGADLGQRVGLVPHGDDHAAAAALGELEREAGLRGRDLGALERATDESLDRVHRVSRVDQAPVARLLAHQYTTLRVERYDRGDETIASLVGEDGDLFAVRHGHDGVRRAEVDS
jgi:hypothetical protein